MTMADVVTAVLLITGASFTLLAGVGALRFPDLYSRMHAATKATAFGFVLIAVGADIQLVQGRAKLLLAIALVLLTTPVAAHLVGRLSYRAPGVDLRIDERDELADATTVDEPPARDQPDDQSVP
jgi:multicomponent Na+:H+ antiporter subunit G